MGDYWPGIPSRHSRSSVPPRCRQSSHREIDTVLRANISKGYFPSCIWQIRLQLENAVRVGTCHAVLFRQLNFRNARVHFSNACPFLKCVRISHMSAHFSMPLLHPKYSHLSRMPTQLYIPLGIFHMRPPKCHCFTFFYCMSLIYYTLTFGTCTATNAMQVT